MNPDRLSELRRQRDLVAEHLAWLDREIAATQPSPPPPAPLAAAPGASVPPEFEEYKPDAAGAHHDTKRGCVLYLAAALLALGLALGAIYFLFYRDRPLL